MNLFGIGKKPSEQALEEEQKHFAKFEACLKKPLEEICSETLADILSVQVDSQYLNEMNINTMNDFLASCPAKTVNELRTHLQKVTMEGQRGWLTSQKAPPTWGLSGAVDVCLYNQPLSVPLTDQAEAAFDFQSGISAAVVRKVLESDPPELDPNRSDISIGLEKKPPATVLLEFGHNPWSKESQTSAKKAKRKSMSADEALEVDMSNAVQMGSLFQKKFKTSSKFREVLRERHTSPLEVYEVENADTVLYLHALFALLHGNVVGIEAQTTDEVLAFVRILETKARSLQNDIAAGEVDMDGHLGLANELCKTLNEFVSDEEKVDMDQMQEARAKRIERKMQEGPDGLLSKIFPNLTYVKAAAWGESQFSARLLQPYLGQIKLYSTEIVSPFAPLGVNVKAINMFLQDLYVLVPFCAYYEFKLLEPADGLTVGELYSLWELRQNFEYEVVVTTFAGLARCRTGLVVVMNGYYQDVLPQFELKYDLSKKVSIGKEISSTRHMISVLNTWEDDLGLQIQNFCFNVKSNLSPPCYLFYVEVNQELPDRFYSTKKGKRRSRINPATHLDRVLQKSDDNFKAGRLEDHIGETELVFLKAGTFKEVQKLVKLYGGKQGTGKLSKVITHRTLLVALDAKRSSSYNSDPPPRPSNNPLSFLFNCGSCFS